MVLKAASTKKEATCPEFFSPRRRMWWSWRSKSRSTVRGSSAHWPPSRARSELPLMRKCAEQA